MSSTTHKGVHTLGGNVVPTDEQFEQAVRTLAAHRCIWPNISTIICACGFRSIPDSTQGGTDQWTNHIQNAIREIFGPLWEALTYKSVCTHGNVGFEDICDGCAFEREKKVAAALARIGKEEKHDR